MDARRAALAPTLDGLSILHLSDLHFTGRVDKAYFHEVVRVSNDLQPDLVCITGDIVDRSACLDWIPDTLGRLTARHGVYFVLGNHDLRVDAGRLRRMLEECGLVSLGDRQLSIEIGGMPVLWPATKGHGSRAGRARRVGQACAVPPCDAPENVVGPRYACPTRHGPLRVVLAHTPDQFAWARSHNADLMLAGHTHGGQIRIPPLARSSRPRSRA